MATQVYKGDVVPDLPPEKRVEKRTETKRFG